MYSPNIYWLVILINSKWRESRYWLIVSHVTQLLPGSSLHQPPSWKKTRIPWERGWAIYMFLYFNSVVVVITCNKLLYILLTNYILIGYEHRANIYIINPGIELWRHIYRQYNLCMHVSAISIETLRYIHAEWRHFRVPRVARFISGSGNEIKIFHNHQTKKTRKRSRWSITGICFCMIGK